MLMVPTIGLQARRDVARFQHGIPAGLARAIHARFGPGPIALGHAPLISGIKPSTGGWKVKASAQSLAARIAPDGMVSAHLAGSGAVSLTPVELSSGGVFARLSTGGDLFKAGRLQVRLGPVTGAYQLTAGGLEQRFTVNRALSRDAPQLTLTFSSPVRWRTIRAGSAIVPSRDGDGRIAYAGLRATDARGRVLLSHFALTARGPEIVTDTTNAAYPITIDPTWTTTSAPTTTLDIGVENGYATALSGNGTTALVGAEGAAYIFHATSEGSWSSSSTLTATLTDGSDSVDQVLAGSSVALSSDGTTALIGAPGADWGLGAAYVFHVSSQDAWASSSTPTATLKQSVYGSTSDNFGSSVALSSGGLTALIGADGVNSFAGGAYVFQATTEDEWETTSTPAATLTNSSGLADDQLGSSAALSADGSTALIGADGVNSGTGAAYVFQVPAGDTLASSTSPNATLTNSGGSDGDGFGSSVALSSDGTTALIGAGGVNSDSGAAYVYLAPSGGTWADNTGPKATLTDGGVTGDSLGASVALSSDGTTALIGASDVGDEATAYVFSVAMVSSWASTPSPNAALSNGFSGSGQNLDSSVALSSDGTTALIGAPAADASAGAAYVFPTSSTDSAPAVTLTGPSTAPAGDYGYSVAISKDGTTALVGAEGEAFIFQTSTEGSWASSSVVTATLIDTSGDTGAAPVALSADGTTALIGDSGGNGGIGEAYVFHVSSEGAWASSTTPTPTATLTDNSGFVGGELGASVSLSSDGTTALIGAPNVQVGGNGGAGAAYVFQASAEDGWASAPSTTPTATLTDGSGTQSAVLGSSVALSYDGTTALIGAPGVSAAYVFQVSGESSWNGSISAPNATLTDSSATPYAFAHSVALSEDGTTALLGDAGSPEAPGAAYVYQVSSEASWTGTGSITTPTATLTEGPHSYGDYFGTSVSLSYDGETALIGAIGVNSGTGAAYVYQVSTEDSWTGSISTPTATLTNGSGVAGDHLGSSVALSSDGTIALIGADSANGGSGGGGAGATYVFSPPTTTYTLTAATNGSGVGTVTSADNAINCGATCTSTYGSGSQVTLNAQPGLNSTFTGWSGDGCSGTASCTAEITQNTTVTATFTYVAPPPSLTVSLTGTAGAVSSSPAGISCPGTCAANFTPGTVLTLTATPASGGTFAGWSSPSCKVLINGACSVTTTGPPQTVSATFTTATVLPQEGLSVSLAGTGTGSVSSSPTGISCPGTCTSDFAQGTVVTLTPSPASGATFAGWSGAGCSGTGTCNVSMSSAQTVTATYTAVSAKPSCTLVPQGAKVTVPAKPSNKHPLAAALKVAARCDQSAAAKMTGTITAAKKHAKAQTFTISVVKAAVTAGKTHTITVKLPKSALTALEAGERESVSFTLTAANANGTATATAKVAKLKLVKTST
jgi:hypothetical protein